MKFVDYRGITLCSYNIFDCYPLVRAFTGTRIDSSFELNNKPQNNNYHNAYCEPPEWLSALGIDPGKIAKIKQVHGNGIAKVREPGFTGESDGLVTNKKELFLRVVTADCIPVFLYDSMREVIGLVHAGWRGLHQLVVRNAVEELIESYDSVPSAIYAAAGPFIQQRHYEVGADVALKFPESATGKRNNGKYLLDLGIVVRNQLLELQIPEKNIEISDWCTFADEKNFHSYRRDGEKAGRLTSFIMMRE